jgi:hypothetical protein
VPTDPESLYLQLGQLVTEMPDLSRGAITAEMNRWLGRAAHLVKETGALADAMNLSLSANNLDSSIRDSHVQTIKAIVFRALAQAEANAPSAARGGFVGVGAPLDALQVIASILAQARQDVLIVDPYMDSKVLTDFAPSTAAGVSLRLLSDGFYTKPAVLVPAMTRYRQQFTGRSIEIRLTAPRVLHDRLIVADRASAWTLTQSLKDFANRSPALAQKVDSDLAQKKIEFYEQVWGGAAPVT